jgi:succinate dehydrogenase / fumarate reductase cytochrome b subunit
VPQLLRQKSLFAKDFVLVTATSEAKSAKANSGLHDPFIWHKLHSLTGIFPIGFFLVQHLIANSYVLRGPRVYNTVVAAYAYLPFVAVLEVTLIYIPILYHSIYGFYISAYGSPNVGTYPYLRNWMYTLQRISGVVMFFFIGFHVWNTSLQKYLLDWQGDKDPARVVQYVSLAHQMANPWMYAFYIVGVTATVFHFAYGIWGFCIRWGLTISARSQKSLAYLCAGIFFIFTGMGLWTALSLHDAGIKQLSKRAGVTAASQAGLENFHTANYLTSLVRTI